MHIVIGIVVVLAIIGGSIGKIRSGEASTTLMIGAIALLACIFSYILSAFFPIMATVGKYAGVVVILCVFAGIVKFVFGRGR